MSRCTPTGKFATGGGASTSNANPLTPPDALQISAPLGNNAWTATSHQATDTVSVIVICAS